MSDTNSDSDHVEVGNLGGRFTDNIEEVFYVSLPIPPLSTFSCHICSSTAQNLKTHNSLKKHFKQHHSSVIVRFECRICKFELPGVKSYAAHAVEFHCAPPTDLPVPPAVVVPPPNCSPTPDLSCATQVVDGLDGSPPPPLRSEDIAAFISEARLRSSPERPLLAPSPFLAVPHAESVQYNNYFPLPETTSSFPHPPGLRVNFGPRERPLPSGPAEHAVSLQHRPLDGDTLWTWSGTTNVLYDGPHPTVLSGSWERGGGGRCFRPRFNQPHVTDEVLQARHLLLNSASSPRAPSITSPTPPDVACPLPSQSRSANIPTSPTIRQLSLPPWNLQAGHFDIPPSRSRRRSPPTPRIRITTPLDTVGPTGPPRNSATGQPAHRPVRRPTDTPVSLPVEDIVPLAEPPQPKLTEAQRQWIEKFNNLLPNDLDGLSALSLEISTAAAAKQVAAPPPPSRNPARPNQGGNRAPHRRPRYDPQDASTIQKLYKLDRI